MNIKTLNALMAKVMDKVLEGKTIEEVGAIVMDGEVRTTVVYKGNTYEFVVLDTELLVQALSIKLNKSGVCSSVYIDEGCIKDFKHINTLSELLDDIYKEWETKVNELSSDEQEVDKFMDVSI
ncbi:hypothetical protein [Staphylococcus phage ZCSS1]|uniref:Uncharacterized protein n=1 Tax=Staphylococcus phage UHP46 TaxID=3234966 RepID=A0AB39C8H6_9CAUD|nr:hypothetical protein [Staphylococcus phage ZCSS1]